MDEAKSEVQHNIRLWLMHAAHALCDFGTYGKYASQELNDSMVPEEDDAVPAQEFSMEEKKNREESRLEKTS